MIDPVSDRRPPVSPQLAVRVAALGVGAFVLFAVIFFRLWYLQVLSGDQYLAQAQTNKVRVQPLPAPRGSIVDRDGNTIVGNRSARVVKLKPATLPDSEKAAAVGYGADVIRRSKKPKGHQGPPIAIPPIPADLAPRIRRLATTLAIRSSAIQGSIIRGLFLAGYAPIVIKTDVSEDVQGYIAERQNEFPGVSVDPTFLRSYPNGDLAAQILGTTGQVSPAQLQRKVFPGVPAGSVVGQSGIERQYDSVLRGRDGKERLLVDAQGNPRGEGLRVEPQPGSQLQLTLSLKLQRAAQAAYRSTAGSLPGAIVAMDPRTGDVLSMASFPTFNPNLLVGNISTKVYNAIFNNGPSPEFNRATEANYSTGSTFKPITALAALQSGKLALGDQIDDPGFLKINAVDTRYNANHTPYGRIDLVNAIRVSSDVFFYGLGLKTNTLNPHGGAIQRVARELGLEHATGIDLPSESTGLVPDPLYRARVGQKEQAYEQRTHKPCCLYSDKRPWTEGDNVNLAIGQGDLQATPLQMAVVYSGFAEGGRVPTPRLGAATLDDKGLNPQALSPSPSRQVKIQPLYGDAIMQGLHLAASAQGGTSADVFAGWNQSRFPVFGKTGTVQYNNKNDQSWYVAYSYDGPNRKRPIVVAVTVEEGGFGAARAAPIACQIIKKWFSIGSPGTNKQAACAPGKNATL